ncbi:MAG TPA: hypothetical protein VMV10_07830 [Pirellulales bacterium]|nr:hypothetical protein [Pirellulales bacterium]
MQRMAIIAVVAAAFQLGAGIAEAGAFRHNSLLRHYGPRGVYPAHFYNFYAPPTGYGRWGFMAYQAWGVGYNSYPYPYRAYYAGYGYGGYKTGESYPFFNHYGYPYPPQTQSAAQGAAPRPGYGPRAQPEPSEPELTEPAEAVEAEEERKAD